MLQPDKNRNIVQALHKREIGNYLSTIRSNPKILRRHVESEDITYKKCWITASKTPISYAHGYLFFDHYSKVFSVYGRECLPAEAFKMQATKAKERVIDLITYCEPVVKGLNSCFCSGLRCVCLRRYFILLTKDQWLIQCDFETGVAFKQMFVKSVNHSFKFGNIFWIVYGSQFTLTSYINSDTKSNVVVYMAVFSVLPLTFKMMFEVTKEVFGEALHNVNVSEQLFIAVLRHSRVHVYSFEDVLKEGVYLTDEDNTFGMDTKGLKLNFRIQRAPPVLIDVYCLEQSVQFGGFPYHCLFTNSNKGRHFILKNLENDNVSPDRPLGWEVLSEWYKISFHPDSSNRVIIHSKNSVVCHKIINDGNSVGLTEDFVIQFPHLPNSDRTLNNAGFSSFGRKLRQTNYYGCAKSIHAMDYEDKMDLIAILGVYPNDYLLSGFVKLFDGSSGKELKTIDLDEQLNQGYFYQLYIDLDIINVIVRRMTHFKAIVYRLDLISANSF